MDMYHTIKRISEGCQETRHSVNKRNCVYSDVEQNRLWRQLSVISYFAGETNNLSMKKKC